MERYVLKASRPSSPTIRRLNLAASISLQENRFTLMNKLFVFFLLLAGLSLDAQRTRTTVEWSAEDKLVWADFKGKSNRVAGPDALTHVLMGYEFETLGFNHFEFKLNITFQCMESWIKNEKQSDYLLAHEQLHFDIHELFARKFMKYAHEARVFDNDQFSKSLKRVFNKTFRELKEMQEAYDHETDHSRNREAQAIWNKKIARLLRDYSKWQQRTFEFKV